MPPTRLSSIEDVESANKKQGTKTPSQYPMPVFTLCPPVYVDTAIANNAWMKKLSPEERKIDKDKFFGQWYNLYNVLAANSLVYLIPPVKGLQDQTYVNSFVYLPHLKDRNVIVLSNFTAQGREGEEDVAALLFKELGYEVFDCPIKFEGGPELKFLRGDFYLGGYGFRTEAKALDWLESQFGAKIIKIKETDEHLYHLDCSVFVMSPTSVMICADIMDSKTVREIEKIAAINPVSQQDAHQGICNSLKVEQCIYNSSALPFMKKTDPDYEKERHKNESLEKICSQFGYELLFQNMDQCTKSGAMLSCFCEPLTNAEVRAR